MTSKLIEALNKCETRKSYEGVTLTLIDDELLAHIEESLERLEVLEKENKDLQAKVYELDTLKLAIQNGLFKATIQENEKLKKVIEILIGELNIGLIKDIQKYDFVYYWLSLNGIAEKEISKIKYELLKEVLGNV